MPKKLSHEESTLASRFTQVQKEINNALGQSKRAHNNVLLVAVSKGHSFAAIEEAYKLGLRDFGESYAQELQEKIKLSQEKNLHDIKWHFIGGIQSNKLKSICAADYIHSVASVRHARLIGKMSLVPKKIFCQINLSLDKNRQGFLPEEIVGLLPSITSIENIEVVGLMAILPLVPQVLPGVWFKEMESLKSKILKLSLLKKVKLSMGMSDDFRSAIMHGADIIRVGTKIFGPKK